MEYGIVYLLTNPVMPGLVKIGMTAQNTQTNKDLQTAKDHARDLERQLSEALTKGGGNVWMWIAIIAIVACVVVLIFK